MREIVTHSLNSEVPNQPLYLLTLEPVTEIQADKNSYGFRPKRCAADASQQCFLSLAGSI